MAAMLNQRALFSNTVAAVGLFLGIAVVPWAWATEEVTYKPTSPLYNQQKLDKAITQKPIFVMFYPPWCSHSQAFLPKFDKLFAEFQAMGKESPVDLVRIDCVKENHFCKSNGIRLYPGLKLFTPENPGGVQFKAKRSLDAVRKWMKEQLKA